ncbi:helix-turn-helix transcriptional regulator [Mesorhizobium sp. M0207]|uniref:PadR family transcriptional regulator n=1 Tax=Mesorhizobium sp. M0207 TaxID=2956915 RepID=UPI0033371BDA
MEKMPRLSNVEYEILNLLRAGEMYGLEMVRESSLLKRGTVYVTLDRMVAKGFLTSRSEDLPHEAGIARRMYKITALGQRVRAARDAAETAFARGALA